MSKKMTKKTASHVTVEQVEDAMATMPGTDMVEIAQGLGTTPEVIEAVPPERQS